MPIVGLGLDQVELQRVERLISRDEDIFRARILSAGERSAISIASSKHQRALGYAASIAAKEAFLKALGTGLTKDMRWPEIEIVDRRDPKPRLSVSGEAARRLAGLGADGIKLSISCTRDPLRANVTAIVILTCDSAQQVL
jgi:holo-[acyl-carrier protein] synthase